MLIFLVLSTVGFVYSTNLIALSKILIGWKLDKGEDVEV
jgi:hypothetical protein